MTTIVIFISIIVATLGSFHIGRSIGKADGASFFREAVEDVLYDKGWKFNDVFEFMKLVQFKINEYRHKNKKP